MRVSETGQPENEASNEASNEAWETIYDTNLDLMHAARDFPNNTCPASRHCATMAEALILEKSYSLLDTDAAHCGGSIATVVRALWTARSDLEVRRHGHYRVSGPTHKMLNPRSISGG